MTRIFSVKLFFLTVALILFTACAAPTPSPFSLADTQWTLVSMTRDGVTKTPAAGRNVTLAFSRDGKVSGNSGCNSFGGNYETQGEVLKISALVSTLMACAENDAMEFEAAYVEALQNAQLYEKRGAELTITFANGNGKLVFRQG